MLNGYETAAAALMRHAHARPEATFVEIEGRPVSYGQALADLRQVLGGLNARGLLDRGPCVGVEGPDFYRHWLLLMAFEAVGTATVSLITPPDGRQKRAMAAQHCALILHHNALDVPGEGCHTQPMDPQFWESIGHAAPLDVPAAPTEDEPVRLVATSGTTGAARLMWTTRSQIGFRRASVAPRMGFNESSRYLVTVGFTIQAEYRRAHLCLAAGGTCVFRTAPSLAAVLRATKPSHVALFPRDLQSLEGAGGLGALRDCHVWALGGHVVPEQRDRVIRAGVAEFTESYSSNETGVLAYVSGDGALAPLPGVEMRIERFGDDATLEGPLWVRSPGLVSGYADGTKSPSVFRDGWFQPGDLARQAADGRVRLLGRQDDLLNIGGLKFDAAGFEAAVIESGSVRDLGVVVVSNTSGEDRLCAVVVHAHDTEHGAVEDELRAAVAPPFGSLWILRYPSIPRGPTGKLQRSRLVQQIARDWPDRVRLTP